MEKEFTAQKSNLASNIHGLRRLQRTTHHIKYLGIFEQTTFKYGIKLDI